MFIEVYGSEILLGRGAGDGQGAKDGDLERGGKVTLRKYDDCWYVVSAGCSWRHSGRGKQL